MPVISSFFAPRHCAGLYRFLGFLRLAVNLDEHGVVDIGTKGIDRFQIGLVPVSGQLHPMAEATG